MGAVGDGQGGDTGDKRGRGTPAGEGARQSKTEHRNVRERGRGDEVKRLRGGPSDSPKPPAGVGAAAGPDPWPVPPHSPPGRSLFSPALGRPPGASL